MGCSSGREIKIFQDKRKNSEIKIFSKNDFNFNNFNMDLIENFFSKTNLKIYFNFISKYQNEKLIDDVAEFSGIFSEIQEDFDNLFKRSQIELIFPKDNLIIDLGPRFKIECEPANLFDLDLCLPLFFSEICLYPTSFLRKSKIKSIVLVHSILYSDAKNFNQYRAAVPDYLHTQSFYISTKERNVTYIKNIIHHEFFHFIDWIHDNSFEDEDWKSLNKDGFEYKPNKYDHNYLSGGFLTPCSISSIEEDKAEIFYFLMMNPKNYVTIKDQILLRKIRQMISFLKTFDPDGIGSDDYDYFEFVEFCRRKFT